MCIAEHILTQVLKPQRGDMSIAMPNLHTPKAPAGRHGTLRYHYANRVILQRSDPMQPKTKA